MRNGLTHTHTHTNFVDGLHCKLAAGHPPCSWTIWSAAKLSTSLPTAGCRGRYLRHTVSEFCVPHSKASNGEPCRRYAARLMLQCLRSQLTCGTPFTAKCLNRGSQAALCPAHIKGVRPISCLHSAGKQHVFAWPAKQLSGAQ